MQDIGFNRAAGLHRRFYKGAPRVLQGCFADLGFRVSLCLQVVIISLKFIPLLDQNLRCQRTVVGVAGRVQGSTAYGPGFQTQPAYECCVEPRTDPFSFKEETKT